MSYNPLRPVLARWTGAPRASGLPAPFLHAIAQIDGDGIISRNEIMMSVQAGKHAAFRCALYYSRLRTPPPCAPEVQTAGCAEWLVAEKLNLMHSRAAGRASSASSSRVP